jgi:uncharacterized delta-60 repeat protein
LYLEPLEDRTLLSSGDLDPGFGTNGRVLTDFGGTEEARGVASAADGKIVVVGSPTGFGVVGDFHLARYNRDGSLDGTFGTTGRVTTNIDGDDEAQAVALQPDGKIVVAGRVVVGGFLNTTIIALARYHPNGTLDTSFDSDGKITTEFSSTGSAEAASVLIQPDGKIVVAGSATTGGFFLERDFALARYNPNGTLDPTFGISGRGTTPFAVAGGFRDAVATRVALQPDGKLVVAGHSLAQGTSDFALVRYSPNGRVDTSFGTNGVVLTDFGGGSRDEAHGLVLQNDGRIIVAGSSRGNDFNARADVAVARYNADGTPDPTFGRSGQVRLGMEGNAVFPTEDVGTAVGLQPNGKFVVAGYTESGTGPGPSRFALMRYNADGSLDTTFGTGGQVRSSFTSNALLADQAFDLAVQPNQDIVVAGSGNGDFAVARYEGDPLPLQLSGRTLRSARAFAFTGVIASLTSPDPAALASAFAATITWGDGQSSPGTLVARGGGVFDVIGTNTYLQSGTFAITTTVQGPRGGTATATSTAVVTPFLNDNLRFLAGLYHDVLGRVGDPSGQETYLPALDLARERALNPVALAFVASDESRSNLVRGFYQTYLGRSPSPAEIALWLAGLKDLSTPEGVRGEFASSPEYFAKQGGTNRLWLDQMYRDLLGRERDPASQALLDALDRGTRTRPDVVALIQDSPEYRRRVVTTVFTTYLGRPAAEPDFTIWGPVVVGPKAARGAAAPSEQFVAAVLAAQEYLVQNGYSVAAVITSLYQRVLGRAPEPAGFESNRRQLLDGYSAQRQEVALALASGEEYYGNLVAGFYARYLGRTATPADRAAWVPMLLRGALTDEGLLALLAGSEEYYRRHGGTDVGWVDALYRDVLARPRGAGENGLLAALRQGASRSQVAAAVLASVEYRQGVIRGLYNQYLRRGAAPGEVDFWTQVLGQPGNSNEKVASALLGSAEYFQREHMYP